MSQINNVRSGQEGAVGGYLSFRRVPIFLLALALLVPTYDRMWGQSWTAGDQSLHVVSAVYVPETDSIAIKVVNGGERTVMAFGVSVSLTSGGEVISSFLHAVDFFDPVLSWQCGAVSAAQLEGAIRPGATYAESVAVAFDKAKFQESVPLAHVAITGILWSDGSEEGDQSLAGVPGMDRVKEWQNATHKAEEKVSAVLASRRGGEDAQHRIDGLTKDVKFLQDITPHANVYPDGYRTEAARMVFNRFLWNAEKARSSPSPEQALEAYRARFECFHKSRVALLTGLQPAKPSKSGGN